MHLAFAYPSRHDLPAYREYTAAVQRVATEIEEEFGTDEWSPLVLAVDDDYARSLAAYRIADVLLVNPVRDGMNLVAKEGPILADRGARWCSRPRPAPPTSSAEDAFVVNPYDVSATADAMHEALLLDPAERRARSDRLAAVASALPPRRWLAEQVAALDRPS